MLCHENHQIFPFPTCRKFPWGKKKTHGWLEKSTILEIISSIDFPLQFMSTDIPITGIIGSVIFDTSQINMRSQNRVLPKSPWYFHHVSYKMDVVAGTSPFQTRLKISVVGCNWYRLTHPKTHQHSTGLQCHPGILVLCPSCASSMLQVTTRKIPC